VWTLAQSRGDGHLSLVTPERVVNEYNEDLIFLSSFCQQNAGLCGLMWLLAVSRVTQTPGLGFVKTVVFPFINCASSVNPIIKNIKICFYLAARNSVALKFCENELEGFGSYVPRVLTLIQD